MFAETNACALLGTDAIPIRVEARIERGLPQFLIVGLREAGAREARERLRCGLSALGLALPLERVTVNLAPADLPKSGAAFDLPMLLAVLGAMQHIPADSIRDLGSAGEIGLDGSLRPAVGTMASALAASRHGWSSFLTPMAVAPAAARASLTVHGAERVADVVAHLRRDMPLDPAEPAPADVPEDALTVDLSDVRGQPAAVRALEIAAAGGHGVLFYGPPGCGKTMLAQRLPTLLPPLGRDEALGVAVVFDAAGIPGPGTSPPFRAPHHTITQAGLVGGGSTSAAIGEISLAHRGVLFLDELPEFRPSALDAMRQPIEQRQIVVRRARWIARFPAEVQLVAAMNLCRCGRAGARRGAACSCTPASLDAYRARVSGPILDRFDMHVALDAPTGSVTEADPAPSSSVVAARVAAARAVQAERWGLGIVNAHAAVRGTRGFALEPGARDLLDRTSTLLALGGRTQMAIVRTARTIADLDGSASVSRAQLGQAVELCRPLWSRDDG